MKRVILAVWVTLAFAPTARAAMDLSGTWEAQTMGTDRTVTVEQRGAKLAVHRVMWPEFEGKKYKLEHLFRGTIAGQKISGDLYVRDDETPQYEALRSFDGKVKSAASIIIDGIELKRRGGTTPAASPPETTATKPPSPPPVPPKTPAPPTPPAPKVPAVTPEKVPPADPPKPRAAPPTPAAPPTAKPAEPKPKRGGLLDAKVKPAISAMAMKYAKQGDDAYAAGQYDDALSLYRRAARAARGMPAVMLHRMGRAHLALGEYGQAYKWLYRALRKDPTNVAMQREFEEAKRKR